MIEIRLSTEPRDNTLITFDGSVLEFFSVISKVSSRFHVFQIANIEIVKDGRGRNMLTVTSKYVNELLIGGHAIRDGVLVEAQALVTAVKEAMALYS
ncbi:MAG: hypothetical protein ABI986_07400 [Chloroflexota bacterium]